MTGIVCGGRNFTDRKRMRAWLREVFVANDIVVHGAARGADTIAGELAPELGILVRAYPADWAKHGLAAGPIRNQEMLDKEKPTIVLAFPSVGGKGTQDMMRRAEKAGVEVINGMEKMPS